MKSRRHLLKRIFCLIPLHKIMVFSLLFFTYLDPIHKTALIRTTISVFINMKLGIDLCNIFSILMEGCESFTLYHQTEKYIQAFQICRRIPKISCNIMEILNRMPKEKEILYTLKKKTQYMRLIMRGENIKILVLYH